MRKQSSNALGLQNDKQKYLEAESVSWKKIKLTHTEIK